MYSISVILTVKNEEKAIEQTIQSTLNQTLYDFELIIINDHSTDNTELICRKYEKIEPLIIEVINQKEKGLAAARNKGLKLARGEYVYFADTQHFYDKNMLADNLKLAQEEKTDLVVFGFEKEIISHETEAVTLLPNIPQLKNQKQFRKHYRNYHSFFPYTLINKIYRRDYLLNNKLVFENYLANEDAFFNLSVYKNIHSAAINRKNLLYLSELKTNKNNTNLFEDEIKKAFNLKQMIEEWEMIDSFSDVIFNEYFTILNIELTNIIKNNAKFSKKERHHEIENLLNNHYVKDFIGNYNETKIHNPFKKALLRSLNKKDFNQIIRQTLLTNKILNSQNKAKDFLKMLF